MVIDGKKYKYRMHHQDFHCSVDVTMRCIGGKWKAVVIWYLRKGKKRFGELKARIPDITDKMLSIQLKALEEDGLLTRKVYAQVPPKVEYELTEEGNSLIPLVESIAKWGRQKVEKEGRLVIDE
ncbi:MAG: helix-turn-helix domain-containing protein [Bacteroidota bacterium]